MSSLLALLVLAPAALLMLAGLLPTSLRAGRWRHDIALLSVLQCLAALTATAIAAPALWSATQQPATLWQWPGGEPIRFSVLLDGPACLMLSLVSFVGVVVLRYSIRYLDGETGQDQYFQRAGFTIGAVSTFVVAGNLLLLLAAWVLTSLGLHRLLLHYSDRPAARKAAWTKFVISRIGDAMLLGGVTLCYQAFGTFELREIFASVGTAIDGSHAAAIHGAAWLFVIGAVLKSAQFPAHVWLPDTLDTPTPVSALMHAGVVNGGGYLMIRLSPILVEAPAALATLAVIGVVTVLYASVVMLTQTSIKKSLAYSTIAQMGFMMLQCGLGAFSAAMLHILAHSLYKAHAFLNSGNVLREAAGMRKPNDAFALGAPIAAVGVLAVGLVAGAAMLFQIDLFAKSGGLVLAFTLALALTSWLADILQLRSAKATRLGLGAAALLASLYMAGFAFVDQVVHASVPSLTATSASLTANALIVVAFCLLFAFRALLASDRGRSWLTPLQIHALNGFYIDAIILRIFAPLAKS